MNDVFDPRAKFLIVFVLTTLILLQPDPLFQLGVVAATLLASRLLGVDVARVTKQLRHFLSMVVGIVIIQSLFRNDGRAIVEVMGLTLLTDTGLILAVGYLCRVVVIVMSGAIIATSSLRQNLQGLNQMGIPFELSLMAGIGLRFLPMLMEEVQNSFLAMELRGIDVGALPLRQRLNLIGRLFIPIIYSTLIRAQKLSESIEARGFVIGGKRSSYYHLTFGRLDYLVSGTAVMAMVSALLLMYRV